MAELEVKILISSLSGVFGTVIGFALSYFAIIMQNKLQFDREYKQRIIEKRKEIYLETLRFIQDYQTKHQDNKKIAISDEYIHEKIYNIIPLLYIYASEEIYKIFNECKTNIKSRKSNDSFRMLADAIRKELRIEKI